jgi:alcohol dehydrogenase
MRLPGYYEFFAPVKLIAGHDALEQIPGVLAQLQARRPMIIADQGVAAAGLSDIVTSVLKDKVAIAAQADDVPQDSSLEVVNRLARSYGGHRCDAIIAVGGGSVMDTAKGVNIVVSEHAEDLMAFSGAGAIRRRLKPLIAVPTTAGTGSEVTLVAVVKDHDRHLKMAFLSHFLLPDAAVLDPRMTLSLPPVVTAATGMDALAHAVEAYTCLAKNPMSDSHATAAIRLIAQNLLKVTQNPADRQGRLAMATAATLAGIAFSNSMVGMVHSLGHAVGSVCGAPHGACMAILLPYGLEYNRHKNGHLTAELLLPLAGPQVYAEVPANHRTERLIAVIRRLNQDLYEATGGRHARCLREIPDRRGAPLVSRENLHQIAAAAVNDGSIFYNPEDLDPQDSLMLLEAAWDGRPLDLESTRRG